MFSMKRCFRGSWRSKSRWIARKRLSDWFTRSRKTSIALWPWASELVARKTVKRVLWHRFWSAWDIGSRGPKQTRASEESPTKQKGPRKPAFRPCEQGRTAIQSETDGKRSRPVPHLSLMMWAELWRYGHA